MRAAEHAYAALSWGMVAFLGVWGASWLLKPRGAPPRAFWAFVFKVALIWGAVVGLLALLLGVGFVWRW